MNPVKTLKTQLRKVMKAKRNDFINNFDYSQQSTFYSYYVDNIYDSLILPWISKHHNQEENKEALSISGFIPIHGEIHCDYILHQLLEKSQGSLKGSLPIVIGKEQPLEFREYSQGDDLVEGSFKTQIPSQDKSIVTPDILLVPLLAFNTNKFRLGYGGGFYDRTISQISESKPLLTIGLAFDVQKVETVPVIEGIDQPLDFIITQTQIYQ